MYNVVEHGRRFYRSLCYSSDAAFCLDGALPSAPAPHSGHLPMFQAGDPRAEAPPGRSLVVVRHLTRATGLQTFVPARLLAGLLPAALLEAYGFWRAEDGHPGPALVGYPLVDDPARPLTRIEVRARRWPKAPVDCDQGPTAPVFFHWLLLFFLHGGAARWGCRGCC